MLVPGIYIFLGALLLPGTGNIGTLLPGTR